VYLPEIEGIRIETRSSPKNVVCELHLAEWWKSMDLRARSVLYLADRTSVNTISTANTKLAISENTACNGCRWK
jgi:hypothetical protein